MYPKMIGGEQTTQLHFHEMKEIHMAALFPIMQQKAIVFADKCAENSLQYLLDELLFLVLY